MGARLLAAAWMLVAGGSPGRLQAFVRPEPPWIEHRGREQLLNFDVFIQSSASEAYQLTAVKLKVYGPTGALELERELNSNGHPPALDIVGPRDLAPGSVLDVFQPFESFDGDVELSRLHLDFYFLRAGKASPPIPFTADVIVPVDVRPRAAKSAAFSLPMGGRILVHDGHDLFSHHRRYNLAKAFAANPTTARSPNLYAYDLVRVSPEGALFSGASNQKAHWLSYGESVLAPAAGEVVASVGDLRKMNSAMRARSSRPAPERPRATRTGSGTTSKYFMQTGA